MNTFFTQASAAAGARATALILNARALSTDMAIARAIVTANTQAQNTEMHAQFAQMIDRYSLFRLHLPGLPLNEVKNGYIEEVLKPHFASEMRTVFDRRLRSLALDPEEIAETTELATQFPAMAFSGLLTFDAADAFCDEYLEHLRQRFAMGYTMLVKFQQEDTAFLQNITDRHLILFPLFAAAFSGIATHDPANLLMIGGITAAMSLMLKVAKHGAARSQEYLERTLAELRQATVATREVQGTLIKHRPQILEVERHPIPPL